MSETPAKRFRIDTNFAPGSGQGPNRPPWGPSQSWGGPAIDLRVENHENARPLGAGSSYWLSFAPNRGVAKLVKALDFDSSMRRFESFLPCQKFPAGQAHGSPAACPYR
ncbi:protein of unknown function [Georgfuchsia toluolica]|uniref:Uncharacterized protein n=1 Tax=Georgfuchsia toluolica TaxID=424218 RepID=A0A916J4K0_9PROT|nr:protein of unknown function [Georgfuchsia toluolica]